MQFSPHINVMMKAAEKAARSLLRDFGEVEQLQVSRKGPADFVSAADKRAEKIIYEELSKARPGFGFLMEESGEVKGSDGEHRFIIDPLDGTNNFLHGIPHWCISIGLERKNEIIAGLVMDPVRQEVFLAEKGVGAFMDQKRLRVSARADLGMSLIAGGDAARRPIDDQKALQEKIGRIISQTSGYRRMGAAALDLCYVAAGRFEGFWELGLKPWDIAAGSLIVREAGGKIISVKGDPNPVYSDMILATNAVLHDAIKNLLADAA
jgi:myo-inositol-1(or 4)-monophosphatase